jgi:hypothetical protein
MNTEVKNNYKIIDTISKVFTDNKPLIVKNDLITIISLAPSNICTNTTYNEKINRFKNETKELLNKCYIVLGINDELPNNEILEDILNKVSVRENLDLKLLKEPTVLISIFINMQAELFIKYLGVKNE